MDWMLYVYPIVYIFVWPKNSKNVNYVTEHYLIKIYLPEQQ